MDKEGQVSALRYLHVLYFLQFFVTTVDFCFSVLLGNRKTSWAKKPNAYLLYQNNVSKVTLS